MAPDQVRSATPSRSGCCGGPICVAATRRGLNKVNLKPCDSADVLVRGGRCDEVEVAGGRPDGGVAPARR